MPAGTMRSIAPPAAARLPGGVTRQRPPPCRRHRPAATSEGPGSNEAASSASRALECSLRLAAVRAAEQQQPIPLFADAFSAAALQATAATAPAGQQAAAAGPGGGAAQDPEQQREALATRFLDEQLLKAVTLVNLERDLTQEYNQVVLVGDGVDTRPFRLPWPEGTVIFCVAPAAVHAAADAVFKAQGARVPRGCLLRRVPADLAGDGGCAEALEHAGFRGDRLSVWVLQGVACLGLGPPQLAALLTDMCNLAAFDSLVAGLLPPMDRRALDNLLASFGLLGAGVDFGAQTDWGRWRQGLALDPAGVRPWLFVAQQKRLSCREMEVYGDHVAAQGEVDEDSDALWFS